MVAVQFRGIAFEHRAEEAASVAAVLGLAPVEDGGSLVISDPVAQAGWRRLLAQESSAGWSADAHRLANALRDAFDPSFHAGARAFHRQDG